MSEDTEEAKGAERRSKPKASGPASLRMTSHFAYWAEDGSLRQWGEGATVTDPDEIADLMARNAPAEEGGAE